MSYKTTIVLAMPDHTSFETEINSEEEGMEWEGFFVFGSVIEEGKVLENKTFAFNKDRIIQMNVERINDA